MSRPAALLLALACMLSLSAPAQARYRIPSAQETLGTSSVIVVGEVLEVGQQTYTIRVDQQIVGPKKPLQGKLSVTRRPRSRLCVPQDPEGIVPGTQWVWILESTKTAKTYRSWVNCPYRVEKGKLSDRWGASPQGKPSTLALSEFARVVKGLRRCYRFDAKGQAKRLAPVAEVEAFAASSPFAAKLIADLPR